MHRTLFLLSKLRFYGGLRKLNRSLASPKGALLVLFTLGFFGLMLLPALLVGGAARPREANPNANLFLHPAALFGLWLVTSVGGRIKSPIAFSLAEVEFLFPGPFTRRQLLVYKLLTSALGALGFAMMVPLFAWNYVAVWWLAAFVGIWWTVCFVQMSTILMTLAIDWFGQRFPKGRVPLATALVIALAASLPYAGLLDADKDIPERLAALESSWAAQAILSPFVVFNRLICALTAGQFLAWGTAALSINLVVVAGILQLDANFLEASLVASQRRYDWLQRVKRSGGVPAFGARSKPRFSLPQFPRLRGAGTIAWRQMLHLMRGSGRLVFVVPALVTPFVVILATHRQNDVPSAGIVVTMIMVLGFLITTIMPLGLRADLDHVDTIKTLPVGSGAIVWGSITSAIVYTTLIQLIATAALTVLAGRWTLATTAALAFAVPVNLLMISSDSVLVLLFPAIRRFDPGDVLVGMRLMLVNVAKMLFVVLLGAIAGFYVFVVYVWLGEALLAMALVGWITLLLEGIVTVWFAGLLFQKYDPSLHVSERE